MVHLLYENGDDTGPILDSTCSDNRVSLKPVVQILAYSGDRGTGPAFNHIPKEESSPGGHYSSSVPRCRTSLPWLDSRAHKLLPAIVLFNKMMTA